MQVFLDVWLYYSLRDGPTYTQWPPGELLRGEGSYHTPIRVVLSTKKLSIRLGYSHLYEKHNVSIIFKNPVFGLALRLSSSVIIT
jgi:hypothetical protein